MKKFLISLLMVHSSLALAADVSVFAGTEEHKKAAIEKIEGLRNVLIEISDAIWSYAELGLKEKLSSELLASRLEEAGFTVKRGVAGLETAFEARWGSGRPVIGILAEYDALPGLSQEKGNPEKTAITEGAPGHGCGHNIFGTASLGAALALKEVMEKHSIQGTIILYGCPAEELGLGKLIMAKEGLFDGLDAAVSWHPFLKTRVLVEGTLAINDFEVIFHGKTAHASADPWNGRSALDALELFHDGINLMREHIRPNVRIHYVIKHGGNAPNIVPDYASGWYFVRAPRREEVRETYGRILKIARGAALATETEVEVKLISGLHEELVNMAIAAAHQRNLELVGPPEFTQEEEDFARAIQRNLGKEQVGLESGVSPFQAQYENLYSTDVAEVSWIVPVAEFNVATAPVGAPWHSWVVVSCGGTPIAHKAMLVAAKVLAATSLDLLTDPELLEKAKEEFREKTKGQPYLSPMDESYDQ